MPRVQTEHGLRNPHAAREASQSRSKANYSEAPHFQRHKFSDEGLTSCEFPLRTSSPFNLQTKTLREGIGRIKQEKLEGAGMQGTGTNGKIRFVMATCEDHASPKMASLSSTNGASSRGSTSWNSVIKSKKWR